MPFLLLFNRTHAYSFQQCFEIRTGPYGPTGKTVNLSQSRFFMLKNWSMSKKQGTVRIAVQPHGFENRNQTASHGSLWIWTFPKKKKKKNTEKQKKKKHNSRETQKHNSLSKETQKENSLSKEKKKVHHVCHCYLQRNTTCIYVSSSSSLFRAHHAAPSLQKLFSWAKQALNSSFVLRC